MATKDTLKGYFADGQLATGGHFSELIDTMKVEQNPLADTDIPTSGNSTTFIAVLSQDANGNITATKKNVSFSGYQTVAGMAGYQQLDLQQVGDITAGAGGSETMTHNMKHYPTVRLMDAHTGVEVKAGEYTVTHIDNMELKLELSNSLTDTYKYILD